MLDNIDRSVNPCDDFYAFSCGGWMKKTDIPPTENDISVMEQLHDTKDTVEREILTTKIARNTERLDVQSNITILQLPMQPLLRCGIMLIPLPSNLNNVAPEPTQYIQVTSSYFMCTTVSTCYFPQIR